MIRSFLLLALFIFISAPAYAQDITTGLVGHWKLDETNGTTAIDYASANNGTMNGGLDAAADSVDGKINTALDFTGGNYYVEIPDNNDLDLTSEVTVATWVKVPSHASGTLACKQQANNGSNTNYCLYIDTFFCTLPSCFAFSLGDGGAQYAISDAIPLLGQWQHVAASADGANIKFYHNGVLVDQIAQTRTLTATAVNLFLGTFNVGTNGNLTGELDDVRLYNRALTAEDVAELHSRWDGHIRYNMDFRVPEYFASDDWIAMGQPRLNDDGMVGHWKLDDLTFGDAVDSSAFGNDGSTNGLLVYGSAGQISYSMEFDGVDDYISIPDSPSLDITGAVTVSAWVIYDGERGGIACKQDAPNAANANYCLYISPVPHRYSFSLGDGTSQYVYGDNAVSEWQHFAAVADGTNVTLYLNGTQMHQEAQIRTLTPNNVDLSIGSWDQSDASANLRGDIDDVRVYNRALSAEEINALYDYGTGTAKTWTQIGADLNIISVQQPSITSLDGETIAYVDHGNDDLRTYSWDGANWSQVGNDLNIAGASAGAVITTISPNTIAYIDGGNDDLRTYRWDGTDWSQIGNGLAVAGTNYPDIASFDNNTIAFYDFGNNDLRTYFWDGNDWSQVGNDFNFAGNSSYMAALNSNTIVLASGNNWLYTYSWDGSDWSQVGNRKKLSQANSHPTLLHDNIIALWRHFGINNIRNLEAWRWDGTDWLSYSSSLYFTAGGGVGDITTLNSSTIAFIEDSNDDLRTYRLDNCSAPIRREGKIIYNADGNVMQYCDGEDWRAMGPVPGAGGTGCINPAGTSGELLYNNDADWMQYCDGTNWVQIGTHGSYAPLNGLIGYWNLNELSYTSISDISGSGNTGSLEGGLNPSTDSVPGKLLTGLNLNGSSDFINIADFIPDASSDLTASIWINPDTWPGAGNADILGQTKDAGANTVWSLNYGAGTNTIKFQLRNSSDIIVTAETAPPVTGSWTHIAGAYDGNQVTLYINGKKSNSVALTGNIFPSANIIALGGKWRDGIHPAGLSTAYFDGSLDEARIYNRALSADEIKDIYLATGGN